MRPLYIVFSMKARKIIYLLLAAVFFSGALFAESIESIKASSKWMWGEGEGETLEEAGEPAQWVAFVERGCFKYMVHNDEEGKDYCTGFAFEGEFVSDFPYCLDGDVSEVSIKADMPCEVRIISGRELQALFDSDPKMMLHNVRILKNLWSMGATSTTTATPPAAATVGSSTAVRRWCRCSR